MNQPGRQESVPHTLARRSLRTRKSDPLCPLLKSLKWLCSYFKNSKVVYHRPKRQVPGAQLLLTLTFLLPCWPACSSLNPSYKAYSFRAEPALFSLYLSLTRCHFIFLLVHFCGGGGDKNISYIKGGTLFIPLSTAPRISRIL